MKTKSMMPLWIVAALLATLLLTGFDVAACTSPPPWCPANPDPTEGDTATRNTKPFKIVSDWVYVSIGGKSLKWIGDYNEETKVTLESDGYGAKLTFDKNAFGEVQIVLPLPPGVDPNNMAIFKDGKLFDASPFLSNGGTTAHFHMRVTQSTAPADDPFNVIQHFAEAARPENASNGTYTVRELD